MKLITSLFVVYVIIYVLFFVFFILLGQSEAGCFVVKNDYIKIHKYINGKIEQQVFATNYSFPKESNKSWIEDRIKDKVNSIALMVIKGCNCQYFVLTYVNAYCVVKNVFYDVASKKNIVASKLYPKNAHAKRR